MGPTRDEESHIDLGAMGAPWLRTRGQLKLGRRCPIPFNQHRAGSLTRDWPCIGGAQDGELLMVDTQMDQASVAHVVAVPGSGAVRGAFVEIFGGRSRPWTWILPVLNLAFPVAGAVVFAMGQNFNNAGDWGQVVGGSALVLCAGGIQWAQRWAVGGLSDAEGSEAERLRVAMKDALQPVAELIAVMPGLTAARRVAHLREVAQQSVSALCLLLKGVDRLRAVVYSLDGPPGGQPNKLQTMAYHGRGGRPRDFVAGTERGDLALELVRGGTDRFERDLLTNTPAWHRGPATEYQTFISASITNGTDAFGMVCVDAPRAGDLIDTDRQILLLVSDLLAIAFAIADRT